MSTAPTQPSTEAVVAALAQSLLPLAGPAGLAASSVVPALQQLYDTFTGVGLGTALSVADLEAIVADGNAALIQLQADLAAQQAGTP